MIKINVTQKIINKAKEYRLLNKDPEYYCPIALALKQSQKKKVCASSSNFIYIGGKRYKGSDVYESNKINSFMYDFDFKKNVPPTTFEIERV